VLASVDELEKLKLRPNFGNAGAVNNLVSNAMIAQQTRVKAIKDDKERQRERDLNRLTVEDFRGTTAKPKDVEEIFKQIVGSRGVIEQVRKLQRTIQLAKRMGKADPFEDIPRNYLFVGPPGTGHTHATAASRAQSHECAFRAPTLPSLRVCVIQARPPLRALWASCSTRSACWARRKWWS